MFLVVVMVDILVLNSNDIESILVMRDVINLVEDAFREKGLKRVQMPPKVYIFFDRYEGDLRAMPAYFEGLDIAGVKIVNSHPMNPTRYGLPTVMALIYLIDPRTGKPLCIMDGTLITGMRTGGAAGVATKYLGRRDSRVVGIVGAGFLARFHLDAFVNIMKVELVKIYDVVRSKAEQFAKRYSSIYGIDINVVDEVREAVYGVDILATLTPSRKPIVMDEWVSEGMHINAMGADAPGKEELDPAILRRAKIVVDDIEQAIHSGEINVPISRGIIRKEDIYGELGEIVAGNKPGRTSDNEITIFDSTGLAIQDVIVAWHVYREAEKRGIGRIINL